MPASLPGSTVAQNLANPGTLGPFVIFDPLSGPKGSPLDVRKIVFAAGNGTPTYANDAANQQPSTGGMSTGIGIGTLPAIQPANVLASPIQYGIFNAGFNDDMIPGERQAYAAPPPPGNVSSNTIDSNRMYIGGGRSIQNTGTTFADRTTPFIPSPYTAGVAICGAGQGALRDGGAGPAFTGFPLKMVSNTGTVAIANGGTIEGSFINRSGGSLAVSQSEFGSSNAQLAAPA